MPPCSPITEPAHTCKQAFTNLVNLWKADWETLLGLHLSSAHCRAWPDLLKHRRISVLIFLPMFLPARHRPWVSLALASVLSHCPSEKHTQASKGCHGEKVRKERREKRNKACWANSVRINNSTTYTPFESAIKRRSITSEQFLNRHLAMYS